MSYQKNNLKVNHARTYCTFMFILSTKDHRSTDLCRSVRYPTVKKTGTSSSEFDFRIIQWRHEGPRGAVHMSSCTEKEKNNVGVRNTVEITLYSFLAFKLLCLIISTNFRQISALVYQYCLYDTIHMIDSAIIIIYRIA